MMGGLHVKDDRHHTARPSAPATDGPPPPPRPPIGLPLLPDGRTALPKGNPCAGCDHCCRYIAIQIETPRTKKQFSDIRWYVLHKNVSVWVDWDNNWMVQFQTTCDWLVDGRCSHYALRPDLCREYDPAECERYSPTPAEKIAIHNERDLDAYLAKREARLAKRRARTNGHKAKAS
jgi:Fe-S-cluster containining protein